VLNKPKKSKKIVENEKLAPPLIKEIDGSITANRPPADSTTKRKPLMPIVSFENQMLTLIKKRVSEQENTALKKQKEEKEYRDRAQKFHSFLQHRCYDIDCFLEYE